MSVVRLSIDSDAPFDWPALLSYLAPRATPGVEGVEGGRYRRRIEIGGEEATLAITADGAQRLQVEVDGGVALPELESRLRRTFDLGADLRTIASHLRRDPRLAALLERRPAARVAGAFDPFELAVRAILGQQVSVAAATLLAGRLAARCARSPDPCRSDGLTYLFPGPREILSADLSNMGMPGARVRSIQRLSEAAEAQPALLASSGDYRRDVDRLKALPGIGEWTAQYIALRALGHHDAFPASDIGLLRAMSVDGVRPSPAELTGMADQWRPYRGYAAMLLWGGPGGATPGTGEDTLSSRDAVGDNAFRGEASAPSERLPDFPTLRNRTPDDDAT